MIYAPHPTTLPKSLVPIFLVIVVDILGMTIILPLLPFYAEGLGASATTVGLLVSTFAVCQLIGGPILGRLSDRFGRRPLLLVSQAGTLIGFIILAYAHNLWLLFISRVIDGFTAGNISLAQAYIADVTKPEERTKSFAIIGIAFGLGFLIGPAVSGFLSQFGYVYPVLVAIILSSASIAATYFLLPSTDISPASGDSRRLGVLQWGEYANYFRQPGLKTLLWQFFLFIFSFGMFMSGFPLFAERRYTWNGKPFGPTEVGYVYAYVGVLGIILQGGLIPRFARMWGDWKLVRGGFFFSAIGFALLGFTYNVPELLAAAALVTFATGVIRPASTSLITQLTSRAEQGSVLGLTQSLQSVAQIVAPFIAGLLIDHGLLSVWAITAGAFCGAGFLIQRPPEVPESHLAGMRRHG
jgi:MFS transporter, DHA1 family, tetracycline resistance protein